MESSTTLRHQQEVIHINVAKLRLILYDLFYAVFADHASLSLTLLFLVLVIC